MRSAYHPTRTEQETVIRWDREAPVIHLWSASPVVWRRMARLGVAVVRESTWPGGAVAGRWYTIPLAQFRWGLRRPGTRPGENPANFARARAARSPRSPQALGENASFSPSVAGPGGREASLPENRPEQAHRKLGQSGAPVPCPVRVEGREPRRGPAKDGLLYCNTHNPAGYPAADFDHHSWCSWVYPAGDPRGYGCQQYPLHRSKTGACRRHDPKWRARSMEMLARRMLLRDLGGGAGGYALLLEALLEADLLTWGAAFGVAVKARLADPGCCGGRHRIELEGPGPAAGV